jgi:hypothetical protein
MEFMILYTEVSLAWVAFAAIVATLRQALGGFFTPLQYVMFRYFVECSLMYFITSLSTVAFLDAMADEQSAWQASAALSLLGLLFYLPFHIHRRVRLGVPMPLISRVTMFGYLVLLVVLLSALAELWWKPSLGIMAATFIFGMATNTLIFMQFLGSFVEVKDGSTADTEGRTLA